MNKNEVVTKAVDKNTIATFVKILDDKKDCDFLDEDIAEIKNRLGGLSDRQLISSLMFRLADYYNAYTREIKKNQALDKQNHELQTINTILQRQCGMGSGRLQVEKAKQGIAIKKKIPFDKNSYIILRAKGLTNEEIAYRMGMSLSTLRRNLKAVSGEQTIRLSI